MISDTALPDRANICRLSASSKSRLRRSGWVKSQFSALWEGVSTRAPRGLEDLTAPMLFNRQTARRTVLTETRVS